jgi:alpha-beta hydrolase superfamily lysophospholipase
VTVNGLRVHYLEWGSTTKPALILLHGIAKHAHTFDHIAADFARDYHVLAVDMRGHGDSGWSPEGAYLVEDYVKDLEGLVKQLGIRRATLLGNHPAAAWCRSLPACIPIWSSGSSSRTWVRSAAGHRRCVRSASSSGR